MEDWQKTNIRENLPKLLSWTNCDTKLLAILHSKNVLGGDDIQALKSKKQSNSKADLFYEILITRCNAYNVLVEALIETTQTGAAEVLLEIPIEKIRNLQISFLGHISNVESLLNPDRIKSVQTWLQTNASLEERLQIHKEILCKDTTVHLLLDTMPEPDPHYIPRLVTRRLEVNPELFEENCSDVFVFKNAERTRLRKFVHSYGIEFSSSQLLRPKITARFIILDVEDNWTKLCAKVDSVLHLIRYEDSTKKFLLEDSAGISDVLRKYLNHYEKNQFDNVGMSENLFINTILKEKKHICICDLPGMGKSLLLASLARNVSVECPERVVAFIQLGNLELAENPIDNAKESLLQQLATTKFSESILIEILKSENVKFELFFDGLDEVRENHLESTTAFLSRLSESMPNARLFVTSRPVVQRELENALGVIAYNIEPFNVETQLRYLTSHWANNEPAKDTVKLNEYAKFCLGSISKLLKEKEKNITGIPLLCKLVADVYSKDASVYANKNCKTFIQLPPNISSSLLEIYSMYITRQLGSSDCNFVRLNKTNFTNAQYKKEYQVKNFHVWQALLLIFPNLANQLEEHVDSFNEINQLNVLSPGILKRSQQKGNFEFVHRTFAEYLVAEFFWKGVFRNRNKKFKTINQHFLEQLVFNEILSMVTPRFNLWKFRESVVAYFLDSMIRGSQSNENLEIHCTATVSPLNEAYFSVLNACLCTEHEAILELVMKATENYKRNWKVRVVDSNTNSGHSKHSKTLQWQHEDGKFIELRMNKNIASGIVKNAAERCRASNYDRVYKFFLDVLSIDLHNYVWPPPIKIAIYQGDFELVYYFAERMSLKGQGLIYWCFTNTYVQNKEIIDKKLDIAEYLLSKCPSLITELWKDDDGWNHAGCKTPIHVPNVSVEAIKFLVQKGCNILVSNNKGNSVVYSAAEYMSDEDFFELCYFMCYVCKARYYFLDPENWVKYTSDFEIWTTKRPTKALFRILNYLKIEILFVEIIPSLKKIGVYDKYKQVYHSLLYSAFEEGELDFVDFILSHDNSLLELKCYRKTDSWSIDRKSIWFTATLYLAGCKKLKILNQFVSRGSNIFAITSTGETILHMAAQTKDSDFFHAILCIVGKKWNEVTETTELEASAYQGVTSTKSDRENLLELFNGNTKSLRAPLHEAVKYLVVRRLAILGQLLSYGRTTQYNENESIVVNINAVNWVGETALHTSLETGQRLELVKYLISRGADWRLKTKYGRNVVHFCAAEGLVDHLRYFVMLGCDVNQVDNYMNNALQRVHEESPQKKATAKKSPGKKPPTKKAPYENYHLRS